MRCGIVSGLLKSPGPICGKYWSRRPRSRRSGIGDRVGWDADRQCVCREDTEPAVSVKRRGIRRLVEGEKLEHRRSLLQV